MAGKQSLAAQVAAFRRQSICCANWLHITGGTGHEEMHRNRAGEGYRGDYRKGMHLPCGKWDQHSGHFPDHRAGIL